MDYFVGTSGWYYDWNKKKIIDFRRMTKLKAGTEKEKTQVEHKGPQVYNSLASAS
jgi:hypothetical protein